MMKQTNKDFNTIAVEYNISCRASEAGLTSAVAALLEKGADGRAHPVTKYCPLYIACYHGHVEIVKLLLAAFPEAVQVRTLKN